MRNNDGLAHMVLSFDKYIPINRTLKNCTAAFDPDETRTRNLLIRSQTPYPLGHGANERPQKYNIYNNIV